MKAVYVPNTITVPRVMFDWAREIDNLSELKTVLAVFEATFGWGKQEDQLSISQVQDRGGMKSRQSAVTGTGKALDHGYISRRKQGNSYAYRVDVIDNKIKAVTAQIRRIRRKTRLVQKLDSPIRVLVQKLDYQSKSPLVQNLDSHMYYSRKTAVLLKPKVENCNTKLIPAADAGGPSEPEILKYQDLFDAVMELTKLDPSRGTNARDMGKTAKEFLKWIKTAPELEKAKEVWVAVAEVTGEVRITIASMINLAETVKQLLSSTEPYSADDVRAFAKWCVDDQGWDRKMVTVRAIRENIAKWTRPKAKTLRAVEPSLDPNADYSAIERIRKERGW